MQLLHQSGEIIDQRYRILKTLGQGGVGTTYQALDLQTNQQVVLKALSLRRMSDWKVLELFEREARILSGLKHPAIPRYLDYFQVDTAQDRYFYIAQQLASGKSLATLIEMGWCPDESQVRRLAIKILKILLYLQSLTPPVIHRDIKPQNIIWNTPSQSPQTQGEPAEERVFLVDFGSVQDTYHHTVTGGSTVVGTYGYMAPEQFRGQAELSTDLYGLGTTLLFLLTQRSPAELPRRKLKINFRSHVNVSSKFADWLEKMLEPTSANRFHSAKEALAVLQGTEVLKNHSGQIFCQPKHSRIALLNSKSRLVVEILPVWLQIHHQRFFWFLTLVCKVILLPLNLAIVIEGVLGSMVPPIQLFGYNVPIWFFIFLKFFILYGIIFLGIYTLIGVWNLGYFLLRATSSTHIEIEQKNFQIKYWLLGLCYWKVQGQTKNITQLKLSSIRLPLSKKIFTVCMLQSKWHKHWFGLFLTQREKEWLLEEIEAFLVK